MYCWTGYVTVLSQIFRELMFQLTKTRKYQVYSYVDEKRKSVLLHSKTYKFLFGEDLGKRIKVATMDEKVGWSLKSTPDKVNAAKPRQYFYRVKLEKLNCDSVEASSSRATTRRPSTKFLGSIKHQFHRHQFVRQLGPRVARISRTMHRASRGESCWAFENVFTKLVGYHVR